MKKDDFRENGMNRVFVDMDGVLVDFEGYMERHGIDAATAKTRDRAYYDMLPISGAIESVKELLELGFDVWIATKPPTGVPGAYSDKAEWIFEKVPELSRKIVITHDKGMLGDEGDFLCDDRPHKANCEEFKGTLLRFENGYHWPQAMEFFREFKSSNRITVKHVGGI